jgi:hypothetical protein
VLAKTTIVFLAAIVQANREDWRAAAWIARRGPNGVAMRPA